MGAFDHKIPVNDDIWPFKEDKMIIKGCILTVKEDIPSFIVGNLIANDHAEDFTGGKKSIKKSPKRK